jgi:mono/diheme cytochrome c family protein
MAVFLAAASSWNWRAAAQEAAPVPPAPAKDYNQRSLEIYEFRKAAKSGPDRGQEIFYYKCWFCHNEFTKDIPKLTGLFQKATLVSGQPVNEETVKNQIRNGSANMAAYKYALSEADLNDLMSYLREKCCWNSDAPPLNPRYIAR